MAVAPGSQCYQAVRRHLRPQYDSIWVPDSLLASAFERYASTFRTGARYGSSVPGPMEHRKRLAKRHMGELHFGQSHSAAPIWDLANLVDLTQWKWSPPIPRSTRNRHKVDAAESPRLSDAVLSSLQTLFSPRTDTADDPKPLDAIPLPEHVVLSGVAETLPSVSQGANHIPLDVIAAALGSLKELNDMKRPPSPFIEFCDSWQRALTVGVYHGEAIGQILAGIRDGMRVEIVDETRSSRTVDRLRLLLLDATIEGLSKRQADNATTFDHVGWSNVLHEVSTVQMNTLRIFTKAMACIPKSSLAVILPSISENLDAFFKALGRDTKSSSRTRQTKNMAVAFEPLGNPEFRSFLQEVTKMVLEYESIDGINFVNVRFSWLQVLARLPGVGQRFLALTCNALETGSTAGRLTDPEVCLLFFMWAQARAPLDQYTKLYTIISLARPDMYGQLGASLAKSSQFYLARPWSEFLRQIGRHTHVASLVRGVAHIRRGPRRLAKIALGMRRSRDAVDILCLAEESRKLRSSRWHAMRRHSHFWNSHFGFKALEILAWARSVNHGKLFKALHIKPSQYLKEVIRRRRRWRVNEDLNHRTAAVGIVSGLSPQLSARKALSLMLDCYTNLQMHNMQVPQPFLRTLYWHLTKQLMVGEAGTSSRLRHALRIIDKHMGRDATIRIAKVMQRRRTSNMQRRQRSNMGLR